MDTWFTLFLLAGTILAAAFVAGILDWRSSRRRQLARPRSDADYFESIEDLEKAEVSQRVREYFIQWAARRGIPPRIDVEAYLSTAYHLDADALEDMIIDLLKATERSLRRFQDNPYYGRVRTLADLIMFIQSQPGKRSR